MNKIYIQYISTSVGEMITGIYHDKICLLDFRYRKMRQIIDLRIKNYLNAEFHEKETNLLNIIHLHVHEFLAGKRQDFNIPLVMSGTSFQIKVWNELLKIPYGETLSYRKIAENMGNPDAVRAVAAAIAANAIALIIPCHRVIGSKGQLTGYAGGLRVKNKLLIMEKQKFNPNLPLGFDEI